MQASEFALKMYVKEQGWSTEQREKLTEFEILSQMQEVLSNVDEMENHTKSYRLADIVLNGEKKRSVYQKIHRYSTV